jgi:hypothetical protein
LLKGYAISDVVKGYLIICGAGGSRPTVIHAGEDGAGARDLPSAMAM